MKFDALAAIQRAEQMKQAQAQASGKLRIKRIPSKNMVIVMSACAVLTPFTLGFSGLIALIYVLYELFYSTKVFVQNVATGEKFYILKKDWEQFKQEEKQARSKTVNIFESEEKKDISDL